MDAFSYLSVLLSIILGLAITQVLQGVRGLLLARSRVTLYAPTLLWSGLILLMATQSWWASFGLAGHSEWSFVAFGIVLVHTTLLYMLAALVLPDFGHGESTDLRAHYYREARPFFIVAAMMVAVSIAKDLVVEGHWPRGLNLLFHALFGAVALLLAATRRPRVHEVSTVLMVAGFCAYIALLFTRLG